MARGAHAACDERPEVLDSRNGVLQGTAEASKPHDGVLPEVSKPDAKARNGVLQGTAEASKPDTNDTFQLGTFSHAGATYGVFMLRVGNSGGKAIYTPVLTSENHSRAPSRGQQNFAIVAAQGAVVGSSSFLDKEKGPTLLELAKFVGAALR